MPQGLGGRRQDLWFFRARRLGDQDAHARVGGRSSRATATGAAVFWVLSNDGFRTGTDLHRQSPGMTIHPVEGTSGPNIFK